MQTFLNWFNHWPWLNPILLLLALLAVLFGYYFYRKALREKKLTYGLVTHGIVAGVSNPKLSITYDGTSVRTLSESTLYVWNKGRQHIDHIDTQTVDRLKIVGANDKVIIYDATILKQSKAANNFRIELDHVKNQILLDFDYINYKEGVSISILHSGSRSPDVVLKGTIKGAKDEIKRYTMFKNDSVLFLPNSISRKLKASTRYRLNALAFIVILLYFLVTLLGSFMKELRSGNFFILVAIAVPMLSFGWVPIMQAQRIPPSSIVDMN